MQHDYLIRNPLGIHARPARRIVEAAKGYPCSISLVKEGRSFNARSLVHILSIGAKFGDTITVIADGDQADEAVAAIGSLLVKVENLTDRER
ncbi:HPr family phosphocarrier protein [Paenibacillus gorillae]|uniref:HPr family phosphocarrier protein n=1 Tax=Paenibacillus gorillae TaxID=1243662 RepID=UPI0004B366DE|nr:HPr family phosphocarrier protein [Paenibacillus gorillae]